MRVSDQIMQNPHLDAALKALFVPQVRGLEDELQAYREQAGDWSARVTALKTKNEQLQGAMDLIAQDALWHDGVNNPEALEDIRKTVKSLGYIQGRTKRRING